jgi:hypothetical protein
MDAPNDRPMTRGYARIERERRFTLSSLPAAVDPRDYERLRDCLVHGTHLRLRQVERPDGEVLIVKLGQKIVDPSAPTDPRRRQMTTLYLDPDEAAALTLDGLRTTKRRYKLREQGWTFCVDVWEAPEGAAGQIVAEVECPSDAELDAIVCPDWAEREVTQDPEYSAFNLAQRLLDTP